MTGALWEFTGRCYRFGDCKPVTASMCKSAKVLTPKVTRTWIRDPLWEASTSLHRAHEGGSKRLILKRPHPGELEPERVTEVTAEGPTRRRGGICRCCNGLLREADVNVRRMSDPLAGRRLGAPAVLAAVLVGLSPRR